VSFRTPPPSSSGTGKIVIETEATDSNLIDVQCFPLDKFYDKSSNVRFISIDTEGHEPFVLTGSVNTIADHRPFIIVEVSPPLLKKYAKSGNSEIHDFFTGNEYFCYKIGRFTLLPINEECLADGKSHNWVCIPKESTSKIKGLNRELFLRALVPWYLLKTLPNR